MTHQHIETRLATALAVAAIVFLAPAPGARAHGEEAHGEAAAAAAASVSQGTGVSQGTAVSQGGGTSQVAGVSKTAAQPALTEAEKEWGVQVMGIRMSAAGLMLDFRYKVLDPKRAAPLLDRQIWPYLIDQASGTSVPIQTMPALGRLRQNTRKPEAGRVYFMMFNNPGILKAGSKVTVVVGGFRAEDLTVEG